LFELPLEVTTTANCALRTDESEEATTRFDPLLSKLVHDILLVVGRRPS
jgi:hypothetical protein